MISPYLAGVGNALAPFVTGSTVSAAYEFAAFGERRPGVTINVPGTYATLALALAGAEVAAATVNSRVLIQLQEGTYDAFFALDTHYFVDIRGMGQGLTILNYTSDANDTGNWGGGDAVVYDMTLNHNGPNLRAGHKDDNIDTSKLLYSRGGAVRCTFAGLQKSAFGARLNANQEFWFIDCVFTTDTTEGLYLNNGVAQSAPCAYYVINCTSTGATYGMTVYSNGSGKADTVTVIGGSFTGATGGILMANAGAGAGEFQVWLDPSAQTKSITNNAGTLHRSIGPLYQAALSSVPGINGQAYSTRYNLYAPGGSGPYIWNNSGTMSFTNSSGAVVLQSSGVFAVQAGYLQANAGVQTALLGPITYGSQTVSTTPVTLSASSGGMHILCSNDGGTVKLPAAPNANQEFTFVYDPGGVAIGSLTIDGNGKTINGAATIAVTTRYSSRTVKYIGGQWYLSGSVGA